MSYILIALLILVPLPLFFYVASILIDHSVHKSVTIRNSDIWDYGTFDQFIKEFGLRKWERDIKWPESFFASWKDLNYESLIHAEVVNFSGKGMVLKLRDYRKFKSFLRKNSLADKGSRNKGIWNK